MRVIAVPRERIPVITRRDNLVLNEIASKAGVEIVLREDSIEIEGDADKEWMAEQVIKAISLGFEPKKALRLLREDYFLEEIDLNQVFRGSQKAVERYKARVIGKEGKAKKTIEELSGASVSVWEDKIAFLGTYEELQTAREAVLRLLEGAQHSSVFSFLEKRRKSL